MLYNLSRGVRKIYLSRIEDDRTSGIVRRHQAAVSPSGGHLVRGAAIALLICTQEPGEAHHRSEQGKEEWPLSLVHDGLVRDPSEADEEQDSIA
jgi:hypothetical protein